MENNTTTLVTNNNSSINKKYAFWARFNQVLSIIQGVFALPIGVLFIIAGAKLNKSIEIANNLDTAEESEIKPLSQNLIESVKSFHQFMVIGFLSSIVFGIILGIVLAGFFVSLLSQIKYNGYEEDIQTNPAMINRVNPNNEQILDRIEDTPPNPDPIIN
jgi:hypothetical protein